MHPIDQLLAAVDRKACPIVVGLDPVLSRVPEFIRRAALKRYGNTLEAAAESLFRFNRGLLAALHRLIPAVKLQSACYELYGPEGLRVFHRTVALARKLKLLVIDDAKRNDIGHSAALYAGAHLGRSPLIEGFSRRPKADFLTVNPFLGSDTLSPFITECRRCDKGLFVLVRTSNPAAREYQEARIDNSPLYLKIAGDVQIWSAENTGTRGYGDIGAVVGATWPEEAALLRRTMPSVYCLVPGYGAQGGTADQAVSAFDADGYGALINSSREIIFAWQNPRYQTSPSDPSAYAEAAVKAAINMRDALLRSLKRAGKLPAGW
jgi:orotidine-5'-phosphate decarboxylase